MSRAGGGGIPSVIGRSGGGQRAGAGGAVTALLQMQEQQQGQVAKLLKIMEKMELENQRTVQAAGQAGSQAAMNVANQITRGIEQEAQQGQRQQERAEDKMFAEQQQRLNAQLQSDAAKEAASIGVSLQEQRDNATRHRDKFLSKKADYDDAGAVFGAHIDRMAAKGWFSSPQGRKDLKKYVHLRDMMTAWGDDMYDDRHLDAGYKFFNKNAQLILSGKDPMDLSQMTADPLQLPMASTKGAGKAIAPEGSISPDKMFEMKLFGGYPRKGVLFPDEENHGLPSGYSPRMGHPTTVLNAMNSDLFLQSATDQSLRQEKLRKDSEIIVESHDKLEDLIDVYNHFNTVFNPMAPAAVERAIESFLALDNPHKFDDVGRTLSSLAIKELFGGQAGGGEEMAILAMEIFDGKRELKTAEEMFAVMAFESGSFSLKKHMLNEFLTFDDKGVGLSTALVAQIVEERGEEDALAALGVSPSNIALVNAQEVMQDRLIESYTFMNRMNEGFWKSSALEQFRETLQDTTRMTDLVAFKTLNVGEATEKRLITLMNQGEALEGLAEDIGGATPAALAGEGQQDSSELDEGMSLIQSMILISDGLGVDTFNGTIAHVTGKLDPLGSSDLPAYLDQTRVERAGSSYSDAAAKRSSHAYRRNERAKEAANKNPSVGESFSRGGAASVITEQVPPLLSLAGQGIVRGVEQGLVRGVAGVAGGQPAESLLRGKRRLEGEIAGIVGKHTNVVPGTSTQNLLPEERTQVIDESQKGLGFK